MNSVTHPTLMIVIVAGVGSALIPAGMAGGRAFAGEPEAVVIAQATPREASSLEATPFQVVPPGLTRPPVAAREPVAARAPNEAEVVEADPERLKIRARRLEWLDRLGDFERVDRSLVERSEGVAPIERFEPAAGVLRPATVERPVAIERPAKVERPEKIERQEKIERVEKVERFEKVERPEKVERLEKIERRERVERVDRSGRH